MVHELPFRDLLALAIGGGWGKDDPTDGHMLVGVIRGADFPGVGVGDVSGVPMRYEEVRKAEKRLLQSDDLLLEVSGGTGDRATGRSLFISEKILKSLGGVVIPASFCRLIRLKKDIIEPRYAYYWLQGMHSDERVWGYQIRSTGIANFQFEHFLDTEIVRLPPLVEQRAIAGVLGAFDDKIESNRRIVKQLDLLLLAHSISLSALPTVALREVSKSYRRPVNPLTLGDEWVDHFSLPAFDVAALPERCRASTIMSGKFGIETTSVLISRLNPGTPRVWCAHVREVSAMSSSEFLVLEPLNTSSVGALWLAAVHPTLGEQMVQRATGTSFSHQRIKSDDALSVEVPDIRLIDEQTRVECDELIEMVGKRRSETEHLSRLRDALLPELLSGRLRVKDAESMMENM